jgi:KUP system potassium uptake protein
MQTNSSPSANASSKVRLATMAVAALGVVYGDIGTSPLYALKETFFGSHPLVRSPANVLGALSLVFWTILIVVTLKYITFILRADHNGEGGIWALLGILRSPSSGSYRLAPKRLAVITTGVLIGAALLYGDGIITPAISILSACEGLEVVTSALKPAIIPITMAMLLGLFWFQSRGTSRVGKTFGPIMVVWFITLAISGLPWILKYPTVLFAVNPYHAVVFLASHGYKSFFILGAVVLCITGAEALYADLGHFGRKAIVTSWYYLVYPSLLLNYFGQGARLLDAAPIKNNHLFYALFPQNEVILVAAVVIATAATVIASQALISGAFSLTRQAMALGFFPRVLVVFTSAEVEGQIYLPLINWLLFIGCAALVLLFKTSSALAAAYGIAVTSTMAITTFVFYFVARSLGWRRRYILPICALFLSVDLAYFFSNTLKFIEGGYVPIIIAAFLFTMMRTWQYGRAALARAYAAFMTIPLKYYVDLKQCIMASPNLRYQYGSRIIAQVERAIVYMSSRPVAGLEDACPVGLRIYLKRNGALPKHVILLNVMQTAHPFVKDSNRFEVVNLGANVVAVNARWGYMQAPDVPGLLLELKSKGLIKINANHWTVQVGEEEIILDPKLSMFKRTVLKYFQIITHFTTPADRYFGMREFAGRAKTVVPILVEPHGARIIVADEELTEDGGSIPPPAAGEPAPGEPAPGEPAPGGPAPVPPTA